MRDGRSLAMDAVKVVPLAFLLAILQVAVMPELTPYAGIPDLVLVLVIALTLWRGVELAAIVGFAAGLLMDAMTFSRLGTLSLLYVLSVVVVDHWARRPPARGGDPPPVSRRLVLWTVVGAAVVQVADALLHELLGTRLSLGYLLRGQIVPAVISTGLVALLLAPLLRRMFAPPRRRTDVPGIAAA
jgi:rod shape-determining protein MreD